MLKAKARTPWGWLRPASPTGGRSTPKRGLVQELQGSQRATVWTLVAMLVLSLLSSGYLSW